MKEFSNPIAKEVWQMIRASRKEMAEYRKKQIAEKEAFRKEMAGIHRKIEEQRLRNEEAEAVRRKKQEAEEAIRRKKQAVEEEARRKKKAVAEKLYEKKKAAEDEKARREIEEIKAIQKEINEQMKETEKKHNKMFGDIGNYWGALSENLVKGNLTKRLKERGIKVKAMIPNLRAPDVLRPEVEYDLVVINGKEIVVVEVKTSLVKSDVRKFKADLEKFTHLLPYFKNQKIYGAVAYLLKASEVAVRKAKQEGFFVIAATGDVTIENKENFKPKIFH